MGGLRSAGNVIEDKLGVFGEIEMGVEMALFGEFGAVKFVDRRIHATVFCQEVEMVGLQGFVGVTSAERRDVDVFGSPCLESFVMDAADGEDSVVVGSVWSEEVFDKCRFHLVVGIDETYEVAGRERNASISSCGLALVLLMNDGDARVLQGKIFGQVAGAIGGAVVDEDDLEVFVRLTDDAV